MSWLRAEYLKTASLTNKMYYLLNLPNS